MRREYVMLAQEYDPLKHKTEGSFLSEKMDGMRAWWVPKTRGLLFQDIGFANKTRDNRNPVCSGLWSRRGKPIFAPDWFLDKMPDFPLDGEFFTLRVKGSRQDLSKIIKVHEPNDESWQEVGYYIFDKPSYSAMFSPGTIRLDTEFIITIPSGLTLKYGEPDAPRRFEQNYNFLRHHFGGTVKPGELKGGIGVLEQEMLPFQRFKAEGIVQDRLKDIINNGGEGVILRRPHSEWWPKRTDELLKVKDCKDSEGIVIGYTYGAGRLHQMMGSVRIRGSIDGKEFIRDLSGFTDSERIIKYHYRSDANLNPGKFTSEEISELFPLGSTVTFTYRALTKDGIPEEARYLRKREES